MRKAIAKALTWRVIGTLEIFAIAFWTTGQIATAGHTAGLAAITSVVMYVVHELAWSWREGRTEMIGLSSNRLAPALKMNNEGSSSEWYLIRRRRAQADGAGTCIWDGKDYASNAPFSLGPGPGAPS